MALIVLSLVKALLTRLLFIGHILMSVWRVADVHADSRYWCILIALLFLIMETLYTLIKRKGQEWQMSTSQHFRFCPSFFFYLLGVIPAVWFLEMDRLDRNRAKLRSANVTHIPQEKSSPEWLQLPIQLEPDMWVNAIEQSMLLLLIVGRWLLPKGNLSRDQLSQLLFVYIGMASDIMELYYLFLEPVVLEDKTIGYAILFVWSVSLLQFCLVLTSSKARKTRVAYNERDPSRGCCIGNECQECCTSEIWSIPIMVVLQDAPFLVLRLYITLHYNLYTYNILFYTTKNCLIILLQAYRLAVICCNMFKEDSDEVFDDAVSVYSVRSRANTPELLDGYVPKTRYIPNPQPHLAKLNNNKSDLQPARKWERSNRSISSSRHPSVESMGALPTSPGYRTRPSIAPSYSTDSNERLVSQTRPAQDNSTYYTQSVTDESTPTKSYDTSLASLSSERTTPRHLPNPNSAFRTVVPQDGRPQNSRPRIDDVQNQNQPQVNNNRPNNATRRRRDQDPLPLVPRSMSSNTSASASGDDLTEEPLPLTIMVNPGGKPRKESNI